MNDYDITDRFEALEEEEDRLVGTALVFALLFRRAKEGK